MRDLLSSTKIQRRGFFDADYVEKLMTVHESGYADYSTELWGLMSFEMWMQRFIDARPSNTVQKEYAEAVL